MNSPKFRVQIPAPPDKPIDVPRGTIGKIGVAIRDIENAYLYRDIGSTVGEKRLAGPLAGVLFGSSASSVVEDMSMQAIDDLTYRLRHPLIHGLQHPIETILRLYRRTA